MAAPNVPIPLATAGDHLIAGPGASAQTQQVFRFTLSGSGATVTWMSGPSGGASSIIDGPFVLGSDPLVSSVDYQVPMFNTVPGEALWLRNSGASVSGSVYVVPKGPSS